MKSVIRVLLRKLGILNSVRRWRYSRQYKKLIDKFQGQSEYIVDYKGIKTRFSLTDPFSATFFAYHFNDQIYEQEGLNILLDEINAEDIIFDVGANIGYFMCMTATYCKSARIFGFEIGRENFKILNKNLQLNDLKNVTAEYMAVSDNSGIVHVQNAAVGNAVLKIVENGPVSDDFLPVRSVSLDDYCRQKNVYPNFLKIDVEGAEMKVLNGMKNLLKQKIKILIEIHDTDLKQFDSSKEEVLAYLRSFGFTLRNVNNDVKKNLLVYAFK